MADIIKYSNKKTSKSFEITVARKIGLFEQIELQTKVQSIFGSIMQGVGNGLDIGIGDIINLVSENKEEIGNASTDNLKQDLMKIEAIKNIGAGSLISAFGGALSKIDGKVLAEFYRDMLSYCDYKDAEGGSSSPILETDAGRIFAGDIQGVQKVSLLVLEELLGKTLADLVVEAVSIVA